MSKQTAWIVVAALAIAALAWVDPLFLPLITLGPLVSGLVGGARGVAPRAIALAWLGAGALMLVSDLAINGEDAAFHAVVALFTATLAAGAAALGALARRRREATA